MAQGNTGLTKTVYIVLRTPNAQEAASVVADGNGFRQVHGLDYAAIERFSNKRAFQSGSQNNTPAVAGTEPPRVQVASPADGTLYSQVLRGIVAGQHQIVIKAIMSSMIVAAPGDFLLLSVPLS